MQEHTGHGFRTFLCRMELNNEFTIKDEWNHEATAEDVACIQARSGLGKNLDGGKRSTSIMMTVMEMVRRVTPPMKEAAPMSANAPGSIQDHVLGGRNTPLGALQRFVEA